MTTQLTPAERTAYLLHAVGNHLAHHPGLPVVAVSPFVFHDTGFKVQVCAEKGTDLHGLLAWATSLDAATASVHRVGDGSCHLHVHATLRGRLTNGHGYAVPVDVWSCVPELRYAVLAHGDTVSIGDLLVASAAGQDVALAVGQPRTGGEQL